MCPNVLHPKRLNYIQSLFSAISPFRQEIIVLLAAMALVACAVDPSQPVTDVISEYQHIGVVSALSDHAVFVNAKEAYSYGAQGWEMNQFVENTLAEAIRNNRSIAVDRVPVPDDVRDELFAQAMSLSPLSSDGPASVKRSYDALGLQWMFGARAELPKTKPDVSIERVSAVAQDKGFDLILLVIPALARYSLERKVIPAGHTDIVVPGYGRFFIDTQMGPFFAADIWLIDAKLRTRLTLEELRDRHWYALINRPATEKLRREQEARGEGSDVFIVAHHTDVSYSGLPADELECTREEVRILATRQLYSALGRLNLLRGDVLKTYASPALLARWKQGQDVVSAPRRRYGSPCEVRNEIRKQSFDASSPSPVQE